MTMQHYSPVTNEWSTCEATKRRCRYFSNPHRDVLDAVPEHESVAKQKVEADKASFLDQIVQLWSTKQVVIPESFTLTDNKGENVPVRVAGEGTSGKRCFGCDAYFSSSDVEAIHNSSNNKVFSCQKCGHEARWDGNAAYRVEVNSGEAVFLADDNAAKARTWYHATVVDDWESGVRENKVYIHVGSREAAEDRMKLDWPGKRFSLFELRIKKRAPFSANSWDDNRFPAVVGRESVRTPVKAGAVTRYVNQFEHPGSVSAVGTINNFQVTRVSVIDPK